MKLPRVGVTAQITGMVAISPSDMWVALRAGRGWSDPQPGPDLAWSMPQEHDVMLHWNGRAWRRVPLPAVQGPLGNLAAHGPRDIWGIADVDQLVHWNGKHWSVVRVAGRRHGPEIGRVVALSRSDAWLAAAGFTKTGSYALLQHWDGHGWVKVAAPTMPGERTKLSAIAAASSDDLWALGAFATGDVALHPTSGFVTEHWDGRQWTLVPQRVYHRTKRWFEVHDAVMLSHTDGWAVGRQASPFKPLVLHWDGNRWTTLPTAHCCELLAVAARAADDVWAVGYGSSSNSNAPLVNHWNGGSWQTVPTPTGGSMILTAVSTLPGGETLVAGFTANSSDTSYPVLWRSAS